MMYIDPKDQPAHPDWNPTFRLAWEERRKLRLEKLRVEQAIEKMEQFIAMYTDFDGRSVVAPNAPRGET